MEMSLLIVDGPWGRAARRAEKTVDFKTAFVLEWVKEKGSERRGGIEKGSKKPLQGRFVAHLLWCVNVAEAPSPEL